MNVLANDGVSQVGIDRLKQAGYAVITDKVAQENMSAMNNNAENLYNNFKKIL